MPTLEQDFVPSLESDFQPETDTAVVDFAKSEPTQVTETSPTTPGTLPTPRKGTLEEDFQQEPPEEHTIRIGEQPATLPRLGKEGTKLHEASGVIASIGEWALNKPEEFLGSIYPPTSMAVLLRYGPGVVKQLSTDAYQGIVKGDSLALTRAATMAGVAGLGFGAKEIGKAKAKIEAKAMEAQSVDAAARENLRIRDQPALVTEPIKQTLLPETQAELQKSEVSNAVQKRSAEALPVEVSPGDSGEVVARGKVEETPPISPRPGEHTTQPENAEAQLGDVGFIDPNDPLIKQSVQTFFKKTGAVGGSKFEQTLRKQQGKKPFAEMTASERYQEFEDYAKNDLKELSAIRPENREEYMVDRALDPLDPMSGVFKLLLKRQGYTIEGNKVKPPAGLLKKGSPPAQVEHSFQVDLPASYDTITERDTQIQERKAAISNARHELIKKTGLSAEEIDRGEWALSDIKGGKFKKVIWRPASSLEPGYLKDVEAYRAGKELAESNETKPPPTQPEAAPPIEAPATATVNAAEKGAGETVPAPSAISQATTEPQTSQAPKRGPVQRPWDIIDEIGSTVGKIKNKKYARPGSEGSYGEGYKKAYSGAGRTLFGREGQSPDSALDTLRRAKVLPEEATVDDLWDAIDKAAVTRRSIFRGETPEIQADKFQEALKKQGQVKGSHFVSVGDLSVGDRFRIGDQDMEVTSIDPDTGEVTVKDGKKFGYQTIPDGADIPVSKGTLVQKPKVAEFGAEDFSLNAPESVAEQKARMAREEAEAKQKAERQKMEDAAKAPLVGSRGDIGQGDLLGGGDLLSSQFTGMGGAVPGEFTPTGEGATAMKYRTIDAERIKRGLEPLAKPEGRSDQAVMDAAMAKIDADPGLPERLVSELNTKPRPISDVENHVLLLRKIDLRNEYAKSTRDIAQAFEDGRQEDLVAAQARRAEWSDKLTELEEASRKSGSARGAALRSLRVMANEDYSLAAMESEMRAAVGGRRLTQPEIAEIERIAREHEEKIRQLEQHNARQSERLAQAEAQRVIAETKAAAAAQKIPPPHIQSIVNRIGEILDSRANAARERLKGKLFTISPEVLKDLAEIGAANIYHIGLDLARWSAKMIEDIGEKVRPHLDTIWAESQKLMDSTVDVELGAKRGQKPSREAELAKQTIKKGDTPQTRQTKLTARIADKVKKGKLGEIAPSVQRLARAFVEQGITKRDALIDKVHEVLSSVIPDWTRRQTMDAISGYGDFKALSKDEISKTLRTLKGQMQQMAKLEDMAAKKAPLRTGIERREVTPEESALIKLVNEAKRRGGYETTDPTTQLRTALDEVKKRTQTQIADYERRLAEEDFNRRQPEPIKLDAEATRLQADLQRIRKRWEQAKREKELAARSSWRKGLHRFVRWERAFKLSSPLVFGKLTAAALTRVATTLAEESTGGILSRVPSVREVARRAPREGGFSVKGLSNGIAQAFTRGIEDAWQTARKGAADIDVVYGDKLIDRDWANFFGQLHGMLKAPVKRFEFELSLQKRIETNIRNGVDISDPLVQTRMATEALADGYRAIFMQRGFASDTFNTLVGIMEKSKKYQPAGEISARVARFLLPVVRVPLNIVGETSKGIFGLATGTTKLINAMRRGVENLKPEEADGIMRDLKKGSLGAALMAIGFFNPQAVGGYDWREKRRPGEAKTGGFRIFDIDIPRWMTHAPWFELMQFGASIRHVKDQHVKGQEKGISEGLWAAGLGLIEETPFINTMLRVDKLFESPKSRTDYLGELAKSTVVPQAVAKAAELMDPAEKRYPRTIGQHIESGIPGLRENVPSTKPRTR